MFLSSLIYTLYIAQVVNIDCPSTHSVPSPSLYFLDGLCSVGVIIPMASSSSWYILHQCVYTYTPNSYEYSFETTIYCAAQPADACRIETGVSWKRGRWGRPAHQQCPDRSKEEKSGGSRESHRHTHNKVYTVDYTQQHFHQMFE